MADETKKADGAVDKLVEVARRRFQLAADAEAEIRKLALEDLKFRAGDQWPDQIKRQREIDQRPCLTINQIPQFLRHVLNDQRQNRPSIQVNPVGDGADQDTAEIIQGIIRHIEYDSGADAAYDTAFQSAVTGGFGYFRILTEYSGPMSFEQDIKIKRILNPFTVYMDPNAKEPDRSDAKWGFIVSQFDREEYKAEYKDSKLAGMDDWASIGDGWAGDNTCRVVEYFYKEPAEKTICLLSNQTTIDKAVLPKTLPDGIKVLAERKTTIDQVKWAKINGVEVLEETDWAGQWIPIVAVLGDELDIDGELVLEGLVRNAKQPQQQYNFMASASTEAIALAPKAPYVAAEGQIEGREREWQSANVKNLSVLQYKPKSIDGNLLPAPQRQTFEPAIQATTMAMMQAAGDLKNVTGIYEAALGQDGNEKSGKAILARQQQSNGANYHYVDNLTRGLRHAGRIILGLIPAVYDTPRVLRIIREDGSQSTVAVNMSPQEAQAGQVQSEEKVTRVFDMTSGKYDVTISTGPSYQTKRQEAVSSMLQLVSSAPQIMPIAGDLLVGNMDWPGAQKIAERLKKALPPQFQDDPNQAGSQLPPEVQQQIAQLMQQNQQLHTGLQNAVKDVTDQVSAKQVELESKERIAFAQLDVKQQELEIERQKVQATILAAQATIDARRADANAQREYDLLGQQVGNAHEYAMSEQTHDNGMQQQAQQQQAGQQQGGA
jgi:hypothetical protein